MSRDQLLAAYAEHLMSGKAEASAVVKKSSMSKEELALHKEELELRKAEKEERRLQRLRKVVLCLRQKISAVGLKRMKDTLYVGQHGNVTR